MKVYLVRVSPWAPPAEEPRGRDFYRVAVIVYSFWRKVARRVDS